MKKVLCILKMFGTVVVALSAAALGIGALLYVGNLLMDQYVKVLGHLFGYKPFVTGLLDAAVIAVPVILIFAAMVTAGMVADGVCCEKKPKKSTKKVKRGK